MLGGYLVILLMATSLLATQIVQSKCEEEKGSSENWVKRITYRKQRATQFCFYFHEIVAGNNTPTVARIAESRITNTSATMFGMLVMFDSPLTVGPDLNSRLIGRGQGMYGSADQRQSGLVMMVNFVLTAGKYNGSTLSVFGRNAVALSPREMPVVGGTGAFRLSRGFAIANTFTFDPQTGNAIVEYKLTVIR